MTNKYKRQLKGVEFDVYDVLHAFKVTNPALQHAIKKLLMPGERGAKDAVQDLKEAMQAVDRAIEMIEPEVNDKAPDSIKYPCYMRLKLHNDVVKFIKKDTGTVVIGRLWEIDYSCDFWDMSQFTPYTPTPEDNLPEL